MIGVIHRNTDNIHAHIATSELKNSRKNYFNERTNKFEAKYKRKLYSIKQ
ncbi:relaxase MobL [Enterococcus sp. CSURQ0835]